MRARLLIRAPLPLSKDLAQLVPRSVAQSLRARPRRAGSAPAARRARALMASQARQKVVLVSAAALVRGNKVLLAQRPEGKPMAGLWEFPGGKVEEGETPEVALARELKEELNIEVQPSDCKPLTFASHGYKKKDANFHLLMPVFTIEVFEGEPEGMEGQRFAWCAVSELASYPMPDADEPLIAPLKAFLEARNAATA